MKHLSTTVLQHILTACAPTTFPESGWGGDSNIVPRLPPLLKLVRYMLNTNNDTKLPFDTWPDCKFWGGIVDAAVVRYRSVGSRAAGAVAQDMVGYWSISATDLRCVKCAVFPAATVNPLPWPLDPGAYKFSDPYSWDCTVTFISSGATFMPTGQLSSDVVIPDTAAPWPAPTSPPLPGGVAGGAVAATGPDVVGAGANVMSPARPADARSVGGSASSADGPACGAAPPTPTKRSAAGFSMIQALRQKLQGSGCAASAKKPRNA